jgi:radical SAM protein with 4Fe4S-binding SPASM domain
LRKEASSEVLSVSPAVILRSEPQYYGTYAAFNWRNARTEYLTREQFAVLEYLSHNEASVRSLSEKCGMGFRKCAKFLRHMMDLGYVQERVGTAADTRDAICSSPALANEFAVPILSAPSSVDVFITSRCNLKCIHCFSSRDAEQPSELSFEELATLFDQLEHLRVFEVRINGGEPLMHKDIDRIIKDLKVRRFRKVILTNGTLIDSEKAKLLREAGVIPTVSLDDCLLEGHELFRGVEGCFKRTIGGMELLRENGVEFGTNCCLHARNMARHEEIVKIAVKQGASRIAFLDLKMTGRLRDHQSWVPSYKDYEKARSKLIVDRAIYRKKIDVSLGTYLHCDPLEESVREMRRGYVSCRAGKTRLSIDSHGGVYPCNLVISDKKWEMGNVKDLPLPEIWFSRKWSFFRGGVRKSDLTKCAQCRDFERCEDHHCRLLPYVVNGDLLGPHPKCS